MCDRNLNFNLHTLSGNHDLIKWNLVAASVTTVYLLFLLLLCKLQVFLIESISSGTNGSEMCVVIFPCQSVMTLLVHIICNSHVTFYKFLRILARCR